MIRKARVLPRLVALGGVLAGSLVPVSAASAEAQQEAPTSCEVHALPLPPGGIEGSVTGASPDGRTLLGEVTTEGAPHSWSVVIWRDGKIIDTVEDPPNTLSDINSHGVAVGGFFDKYGDDRPWVYDNGAIRILPGDVAPTAINDSGRIAGYENVPSGNGRSRTVPVTWFPGSDRPVSMKGGATGVAYDISSDNLLVGKAEGESVTEAAYWEHGVPGVLARPEGTPREDNLEASEINGPWVVGAGEGHMLRWNLETGAAETIPNVITPGHSGINKHGWVVGSQESGRDAVLVADGHTIVLPGLDGYPVHYADSVNADASVIAGTAVIPKGESKPVYWTCS